MKGTIIFSLPVVFILAWMFREQWIGTTNTSNSSVSSKNEPSGTLKKSSRSQEMIKSDDAEIRHGQKLHNQFIPSPNNDPSVAEHGEKHLELEEGYSRLPSVPSSDTSEHLYSVWKALWLKCIPTGRDRQWEWNTTQEHVDMTMDRLNEIAENSHAETKRRNISEINDLLQTLKPPSRNSTISLYNETAYHDLIANLLQSHMEGRNFTIVANGGSSTAGALKGRSGSLPRERRYYAKFAMYLNSLLPPSKRINPTALSVCQGHGQRSSLHASIFFDSFIPENTDLLLWEFAINDAATSAKNHSRILRSCQLNLLTWLYEVGKRKQPPKVILVYYWNNPYKTSEASGKIESSAFDALGDIGRQFDFVIGHVNLAAYIEEFQYGKCSDRSTCPFLGDKHHPSELGHLVTSFLLLNLMDPSKKFLLPPTKEDGVHSNLYKHEWLCGTETSEKRIVQQAVTNSSTGWKSPLGAWTLELPVTEEYSSSRRLVAGQPDMDIEVTLQLDSIRDDRQRFTPLPNCDAYGSNSSNIFSVLAPHKAMKDVRVMLLNFKPEGHRKALNNGDISVHINNASTVTNGTLLPVRDPRVPTWACPIGYSWGKSVNTYWYIFEEPLTVLDSVELCTASTSKSLPMIQSIALW